MRFTKPFRPGIGFGAARKVHVDLIGAGILLLTDPRRSRRRIRRLI